MNIFNFIRPYLNVKIGVIVAIIVILVVAGFYMRKNDKSIYDTIIVKKGEVIQKVSATGKVKPVKSVDLAFENSGKIAYAPFSIGDSVSLRQILVKLNNSVAYASLLQAKANLDVENATLAEYLVGTRKEELAVYEIKLKNRKIALLEANKDLINKISDAFTKSDDAVRNKSDQLFSNPKSDNPVFNFSVSSQLKIDVENKRFQAGGMLVKWGEYINTDNGREDVLTAKNNLEKIKEFLNKLSLAVNVLLPTSSVSQTTIDGYKSDISIARNNINTTITNLTISDGKLTSAKSSVTLAKQELALKKSGKTVEQISAQKARVESAEAKVANYSAQISKGILRAPIGGVITKQDAKIGEIVNAGTTIISIISESTFEIKSNIPEVDIANIAIGDKTTLTLDAYRENEIFNASVYSINPAETVIEGVSTYEVTLRFADKTGRVKSGMTANLEILTNKRENTISVPARAISNRENGDKFVKILLNDGSVLEKTVSTGIRGYDGRVEILSGIKEGDKVITFIQKKS